MFLREFIKKIFIGIILGFSIIIPGLSGSAIAISFSLYDKIINALSNLVKHFKQSIIFLLPLIIGGITGLLIGVFIIKLLLCYYPFYVICFFSGLMIGTFPIILKQINFNKKNISNLCLMILGFIIPLIMSIISLIFKKDNIVTYSLIDYLFYILIGFCLAITQLVPGLSATAFLIIIGYYNNLINILSFDSLFCYNNILVIFCIIVGVIIGVLLLSNFINNILKKRKNEFMHLICGLSISSIFCVFIQQDCINIYKTFNKNNIMINIILALTFIIIGILITTIIFQERKKYEEQ